ncbi:MAG: TonB-dependent receptor [Bacteroidota bacterium]|nr:TonB-dependent receptor [Bacteroidota bacterium]
MEKNTYYLMPLILRIMKLTFYMVVVVALGTQLLWASNSAGQILEKTRIDIRADNKSLKDILKDIESKSKIRFTYNESMIQQYSHLSVNEKDKTALAVLKSVLDQTNLDYIEKKNKIIIVEKQKTEAANKEAVGEDVAKIIVKGKVTDDKGLPLPGVSISIKGTKTGTVSGTNGEFSVSTADTTGTLVFSFISFETQQITFHGNSTINVTLVPSANSLSEVVVVGYGTQQRATVTGAIATVSAKEINTATNGNVVNLLAGKLPGLRVTQRTSEPGDYATDFDIRGFGAPLIVVDGIPRSNFNRLDPNEIESISVLKDASAAIYGVKGGNGVVLITTKRGAKGKTEFNYSSTFGYTQIAHSPEILNSYQFATLTDEAAINAGNTPPYSKDVLAQYQNGTLPSTDWFNLVVRKRAPEVQHSISASGSTDKVQYFLSMGYFDEDGIYKSGDINANRYNFRSNITANLTRDLQAEVLINGIKDTKNAPGESTGSIFQALWSEPPNITPYANNNPAYLNNMPDATNPLSITNASLSGYNTNTTKTFNGSFALNYKIHAVDGLKLRALYAYDNSSELLKSFIKQVNTYTYDPVTDTYNVTGARNAPTTYTEHYIENTSTTAQVSLDYQKTFFENHNIKGLLLVEETKQNGDDFQGSRQFSLDAVDQLYAGNTLNQATTSTQVIPNVNQSIVGRLNYDYKGKYLLEGSFRYEGSSKFADGHKWGFFPAVSGGWRISEEPFLKNKLSFLDNLKIRASYGKLGDDGSSTYQYLSGYNYPGANYVFNGTLVNGLGFRGLSNPLLSWYTSSMTNIGIDADLWNRFHIEADFFRRQRNGLLATRVLSLPGTVGASLPQENLNSDLTKGFEFTLAYHNNIGEFKYNVSGNISFTRTKNLYLEQAAPTNAYSNWRGNNAYRWTDNYFGYKVIGQFQSIAEIKASPVEDGNGNRSVLPGDLKYQDVNHDGIIDDNDVQNVGRNSNTPEINFGFSLSASWKGFDMSALFQGATNYTVSYLGTIALDGPLAFGRNGLSVFTDRWHHADLFDPTSQWIPGKYPSTRPKGGTDRPDGWNYMPSDFWLKDATYLRLKSLEVGYTFPASLIGKTGFIKSLRVYVNGFNLVTWSGLNDLIDPEHTNAGYGNTYPITKNYNFGVNLTF